MPGQGFPKGERIRRRAEIEKVFEAGTRVSCKGMRLHVMPNCLSINRAIFVPVRSYPNAVARNRVKRLMRECWRLGKESLLPGHDLVVVLYPGSDEYRTRRTQLERLLREARLYA